MCKYSTVEKNFDCVDPKFDYFYHKSLLTYLLIKLLTDILTHLHTYFLAYLFIYLLNYFLIHSRICLLTGPSTLFSNKFLSVFLVYHVHAIALLHTHRHSNDSSPGLWQFSVAIFSSSILHSSFHTGSPTACSGLPARADRLKIFTLNRKSDSRLQSDLSFFWKGEFVTVGN
jgi:hypothetical protein